MGSLFLAFVVAAPPPKPPQAPPVRPACGCDVCKCKGGPPYDGAHNCGRYDCPANGGRPAAKDTPAKPRRVQINGKWWDEYPDGTLKWCEPCNGPYPGGEKVFASWKGPGGVVSQAAAPVVVAAPGVVAPQPFRPAAASHNPSHDCPSCGRTQYVVSGPGPVAGSHTHRCAACGSSWWH